MQTTSGQTSQPEESPRDRRSGWMKTWPTRIPRFSSAQQLTRFRTQRYQSTSLWIVSVTLVWCLITFNYMHYNGYLAELSNNISDVEVRQKQKFISIFCSTCWFLRHLVNAAMSALISDNTLYGYTSDGNGDNLTSAFISRKYVNEAPNISYSWLLHVWLKLESMAKDYMMPL